VASTLTTRLGFKPVLTSGLVLVAGGLLWFSQVSADGNYVSDILFPSLLAAVGLGFAFVPLTIASVSGVKPDDAGLASGLINTSQQVGGALGLAILAAVANGRTSDFPRPSAVALTEGFQAAFLVGMVLALVGAVASMVLISSSDSRAHRDAALAGEVETVPVAA